MGNERGNCHSRLRAVNFIVTNYLRFLFNLNPGTSLPRGDDPTLADVPCNTSGVWPCSFLPAFVRNSGALPSEGHTFLVPCRGRGRFFQSRLHGLLSPAGYARPRFAASNYISQCWSCFCLCCRSRVLLCFPSTASFCGSRYLLRVRILIHI